MSPSAQPDRADAEATSEHAASDAPTEALADIARSVCAARDIALLRTDGGWRVDLVSRGAERLFGAAGADLLGLHAQRLLPEYPLLVERPEVGTATPRWSPEGARTWALHPAGNRFAVALSIARLPHGRRLLRLGEPDDRVRERLEHLAYHDLVTGVPNRTFLQQRLQEAVEQADGGSVPAVLFIDFDRFKQVNDRLGHEEGDRVLGILARRLATAVRPQDTIARYGGDEFVVLVREAGDSDDAERVARRVIERLRAPVRIGERALELTVSIGIARYPEAGGTPEALLRAADGAMYAVKAAGGGGFERAAARG